MWLSYKSFQNWTMQTIDCADNKYCSETLPSCSVRINSIDSFKRLAPDQDFLELIYLKINENIVPYFPAGLVYVKWTSTHAFLKTPMYYCFKTRALIHEILCSIQCCWDINNALEPITFSEISTNNHDSDFILRTKYLSNEKLLLSGFDFSPASAH